MTWLDHLRNIKRASGFTNSDLANLSGVPEPTLEKIFSGRTKNPGVNTVQDIVHAMGYSLDDLDPNPKTKKAPAMEDGDKEMLDQYHKLDNGDQGRVLGYMDHLLESEKYKEDAV